MDICGSLLCKRLKRPERPIGLGRLKRLKETRRTIKMTMLASEYSLVSILVDILTT